MKACFPAFLVVILVAGTLTGAETESVEKPGLKGLQLVSDANAIVPGEPFTVGVWFRHEPGYHTYWKSPGIVGLASMVQWDLPEGFATGEIQWPSPQRTKMAALTAWGYETDTALLVEVTPPKEIPKSDLVDDKVPLRVRVGWMCCAASCHPGWQDFELLMPLAKPGETEEDSEWRKVIEDSRARFPVDAPEGWSFQAREIADDEIELVVAPPEDAKSLDGSQVYFFSDDNQVDSDALQRIEKEETGFSITFTRPDFGPKNPEKLSGILFRPGGWPGLDRPWMRVEALW